jgi:hypothetical protein
MRVCNLVGRVFEDRRVPDRAGAVALRSCFFELHEHMLASIPSVRAPIPRPCTPTCYRRLDMIYVRLSASAAGRRGHRYYRGRAVRARRPTPRNVLSAD